jgi:hypothetical protein
LNNWKYYLRRKNDLARQLHPRNILKTIVGFSAAGKLPQQYGRTNAGRVKSMI